MFRFQWFQSSHFQSPGENLILLPGGIDEMNLTDGESKETQLVMTDRKGFVKISIENGLDIIPGFCFGEKLGPHSFLENRGWFKHGVVRKTGQLQYHHFSRNFRCAFIFLKWFIAFYCEVYYILLPRLSWRIPRQIAIWIPPICWNHWNHC